MNPCPKHGTHMDSCWDCCEEYWREHTAALERKLAWLETYKHEVAFNALQEAEQEWLKIKKELEAKLEASDKHNELLQRGNQEALAEAERWRETLQEIADSTHLGNGWARYMAKVALREVE